MKIISYIPISIVVIGFFFASPTAYSQQLKVGAVDMAKVFSEYYKTKKAENELKDRANNYSTEISGRDAELKKLQADCQKLQEDADNPALAEDKRSEKRKALESKVTEGRLLYQQLQDMAQSRKKELGDQQARVRNTIVEEITKVIQEKAKRDGYTLIIDKTGMTLSGVPPFIFVQDALDITPEIIKAVNAGAPSATTSTPPPTAPAVSTPTSGASDKPKDKK